MPARLSAFSPRKRPRRDPLAETGEAFAAVVAARGVPIDQALNPKVQDSGTIKHHGPNPYYGPNRCAS